MSERLHWVLSVVAISIVVSYCLPGIESLRYRMRAKRDEQATRAALAARMRRDQEQKR